jgi:tRNA threonylcarbamoyladenosine biosynthesis protein TsaB
MILLIDTSAPNCQLALYEADNCLFRQDWPIGRELAEQLLGHLQQVLAVHDSSFKELSGIGVFKGPGSFTGLRIGMSIVNTLADDLSIPIVGTVGDAWQSEALERLKANEDDKIVLPEYGRAANITQPRK